MRLQTRTGRRLAVTILCLSLAGAGCDGDLGLGGTSAAALPSGFMFQLAALAPPETCAAVLFSWFSTATVDKTFKRCGADGRHSGSQRRAGRFSRAVGGSGAFLVDTLEIDGIVSGSKLPRWTAVLSSSPGAARGAGDLSVLASVAAADAEGNPAGSVPVKILATLYDVDSKGKRKKVGKKQARFDKKTGGADVLFEKLSGARDHYEVDIVVKGGKVTGGNVSYAAATAGQLSARIGAVSGRWADSGNSRAGATPATTWAGASVSSAGTTVAKKVPESTIVVYPPLASRLAGRGAGFDIIGLAMQADENLEPPGQQLAKIQFTVFSVSAKGKRTRIATKAGVVAKKNGTALFVMEGLAAPASHYEIEAKAIGGKMQDSNLLYSALVAPAGFAGRVLRAGRFAGAQALPPLVERARPSTQRR